MVPFLLPLPLAPLASPAASPPIRLAALAAPTGAAPTGAAFDDRPVAAPDRPGEASPDQAVAGKPVEATPDPEPAPAGARKPADPHLLGDWAGLRSRLAAAGITPIVSNGTQSLANLRGGTRQRFITAGQLNLGATIGPDAFAGALPGTFRILVTRRYGLAFNGATGINALVNPMAIQGRGEIWRLSQFSYSLSRHRFDLKLGRLLMDEDFDIGQCDFIGGYACIGENIRVANNVWVVTPASQWGARLAYDAGGGWSIKTAIYDFNPKNLDVNRNFYVGFAGATGISVPVELDYKPKIGGRLAGTYMIGGYFGNSPQADPVLDTYYRSLAIAGGTPLVRRREYGVYAGAEQQIVAARPDGAHGLSAFFHASVFSSQSALNSNSIGFGIEYSGPLAGRPADKIGFALGTAHINDRITADRAARSGVAVPRREYSVEGFYAVALVPGLLFEPDAQLILAPGGYAGRRTAMLLGFRTLTTF